MISIFYNKVAMNDVLFIVLENLMVSTVKKNEYGTILYDEENKIIGINIFNASKYINLPQGYLLLTKKIKDFVFEKFNIDLEQYNSKKFVVAKVVEAIKIQDTQLSKCLVDTKEDKLRQIICKAPNIAKDLKVVVALPGTLMPNSKIIKIEKIANYDSFGMICGYKELFIKDKDKQLSGIIILDDKYNVGDEFIQHYANSKK